MAYSQANTRLMLLEQLQEAAQSVAGWEWDGIDDEPARDMAALRVVLAQLDAMATCPHCGGTEGEDV